MTAIKISGIPQTAKLKRQELSTSGNISGIVSITGRVSPTRSPLV